MGAEIFDVEINLDGVLILYGTKVSSKKNKESSNKTTFNGDVTIGANNTGGSISIENLYWPTDIDESLLLENKLDSNNIKVITCTGTSYTANGDPYRRVITGSHVTITSDEEEWSPTDGISKKIECTVNVLNRSSQRV
ncbi:hypothetical protein [Methanobrevibacter olleyae]|uniref:Phage tail tube protein n=1 Tax=Methanobrevibacter olleyae TaxID=294671 RepID=A0A126R2P9_METOL|nr:hypothetical protein [Methanobrevibacter olleyae]AMK16324.1 hypothetical protein YLM1_1769 [Methanobrevibacter olleyae]